MISYKCSKCKSKMGVTHYASDPIGQPFLTCPNCQSINIIASERNEWKLMKPYHRWFFIGMNCFFCLFLGWGTGALFADILKHEFSINAPLYLIVSFSVIIWFLVLGSDWKRKIRESNERMQNKDYQDKLKVLGLLK